MSAISPTRSPSPISFNNAQDIQISVNDLTTTTPPPPSKFHTVKEPIIQEPDPDLPLSTLALTDLNPSPPPLPSDLFQFSSSLSFSSEFDPTINPSSYDPDSDQHAVVLDSLESVRRAKLQPAFFSANLPVRIALFHCDALRSGGAVRDLAELLWVCRGPLELDLGSNELDDNALEVICQGLHTPSSRVQVLCLQGNNIEADGAAAIGSLLARSKTITSLNLRLNVIGDVGTSALSNGLKRNRSLTYLNLSVNNISSDGALALADALAHNTTLKELDLSGNDLQDEGVMALVTALKSSRVGRVRLSSTGLTSRAATALAEALLPLPHLSELVLSCNAIGDEGAIAIANSMHVNFSLKKLDVSGNQIGDQGAFAFAHALTMNKQFASFSIRNNHISPPGLLAIATSLLNQPDLYNYNLSENNVSPVEYRHVITLLEESWKSQHSNYFDDFTSTPSTSSSTPSFPTSSTSTSSYLTDPLLTHFLPPTDPHFSRFVPTSSSSASVSSSPLASPYHSTSIYPSPSPASAYSTSTIYPSPPPVSFLPTSMSQATIPPQYTTELPYLNLTFLLLFFLFLIFYTVYFDLLTRNEENSVPIKKEVSFPEPVKHDTAGKEIEDRLKNAIETMKQRVALRNDTFAQLQRARANSLPKRRRSRSQLVDSGGNAIDEEQREEEEYYRNLAAQELENEQAQREEDSNVLVEGVVEEENREPEFLADDQEGLVNVGSDDQHSKATSRWSREEKPFILKRHSTGNASTSAEDIRASRPLYTPPPSSPTPPPPTRAAPQPPTSLPLSSLSSPSSSIIPPSSRLSPSHLTLESPPSNMSINSNNSNNSTPPSPSSDISEALARPDSGSRRRKTTSFAKKEVVPHGPPLPQISNEDANKIRHWFINLPPPFPVTRHVDKKTTQATITLTREMLTVAVKRKFGGTKTYRTKLTPDVKGEMTIMYPNAFTISSPDFEKPFTFASAQRDVILATLIVFIYGASTLNRNRA